MAQLNSARQLTSLVFTLIFIGGIFLLCTAQRARRILRAAALVGGLALLAGCGGSGSGGTQPSSGTPAGSYTVTITATAGVQTASTTVSVVVQ